MMIFREKKGDDPVALAAADDDVPPPPEPPEHAFRPRKRPLTQSEKDDVELNEKPNGKYVGFLSISVGSAPKTKDIFSFNYATFCCSLCNFSRKKWLFQIS